MNSLSVAPDEIGFNVAVPRSSSTAPSDTNDTETSSLRSLILNRSLAALARFQPVDTGAVARICFEMAEAHPDEVVVLLWNAEVAKKAKALLCQVGRNPDSRAEQAAVALARAILSAGHTISGPDDLWSTGVQGLLRERRRADHDYWASKVEKFRRKPYKQGVQVFYSPGKPFYSFSACKSALNLNEELFEGEKPFVCCHWAQAVQNDTKNFLKSVRLRDAKVLGLDYAVLEQRHQEDMHTGGRSSVQFSLENFGRLLVRLIPWVPQGETRSFSVVFSVNWKLDSGHAMRVFLKRGSSKSGMSPGQTQRVRGQQLVQDRHKRHLGPHGKCHPPRDRGGH